MARSRSRSRIRSRTTISIERLSRYRQRSWLICGIISTIILLLLVVGLVIGLVIGRKKEGAGTGFQPLPAGAEVNNGWAMLGVVGGGRRLECGWRTEDDDDAVAVSHVVFDRATEEAGGSPALNRLCGMKIRGVRIGEEDGERKVASTDAIVAGRCSQCNLTDLAFSRHAFARLRFDGEPDNARFPVSWAWL
ncbi:hypothetical protein BDZ91DRAFT_320718 [Kalaharituber pfeilii]|nr:hypothetical protein BDZ91DRAFT_320718 [Kalaharituber pfeilii]